MRWLLRRICFYVFALWVAITLNFLLPRLMPGDPAGGVLQRMSSAQLASNPGLIQTYRDLLGGGHESLCSRVRRLPPPRRHAELRDLDVELPDEGVRR